MNENETIIDDLGKILNEPCELIKCDNCSQKHTKYEDHIYCFEKEMNIKHDTPWCEKFIPKTSKRKEIFVFLSNKIRKAREVIFYYNVNVRKNNR